MLSNVVLVALAAASGASALVPKAVCNANNCLRALRAASPATRLAQAQADCSAWLTVTSTPVETATAYTTVADLTSTLVEEVTAIETVYDTFTTTVRETPPTDTVYTATSTVTVDPVTTVAVVDKRAASPTIPAYASPCSGAVAYSSACSCIGVSGTATVTAETSTTTVTLETTALTTVPATSVVSTSVTVIYDATTTVTVTEPAATVSTEAVVTVTRTSTSEAPSVPTGELANGGFEATGSVAPWGLFGSVSANPVGTLSVDTTTVRTGSQSGLLTINRQGVTGLHQPVTVEADQAYRFTIYAQQSTPACPYIYVGCSTSPSNYISVSTYSGGLINRNWYQLYVTCRWTADRVANAGVSAFVSNCAAGGKIFFDTASLVKL